MIDRKLEREDWKAYFDFVSRSMQGKRVLVGIVGLDLGDQIEEDWLLLAGLSYEPKEDAFYVYTEPLDHQIPAPEEIYVIETGPTVASIGIKDSAGHMQVITIRDPLMIEARTDGDARSLDGGFQP